MCSINKALLPIKAHFFLYSGLEMIRRMLPLVFREKGVPSEAVGMAYSIMTMFGLLITAVGGTVADHFKVHRSMLIIILFMATVGVSSVYFLPDLPKAVPEPLIREEPVLVKRSLVPEILEVEGEGLLESSELQPHSSLLEPPQIGLAELLMTPEFLYLVICTSTEQATIGLVYSLTDTVVFKVLDGDTTKYGQQRMFNAIGVAMNAALAGYLVDWYSEGKPQRDSMPLFAMCLALMVLDISILCKLKLPDAKKVDTGDKKAMNISDLLNFKTALFLMSVFVLGFAMNLMFVFKSLVAQDIIIQYDPDFSYSKLLQGLMISIQCFSASFFYGLTGTLIRRLGHTKVFIMGFCFLGSHFMLYYTISNPWLILPLEMLHGPSYSLLSATSASYALKIAPPGAVARLQASSQFTFFLGYVIAGFVGSYIYNLFGGYFTFLIIGCFVFAFNLFYALCKTILKLKDKLTSKDVEGTKETDLESHSISPTQQPINKSGILVSLNESFMADFVSIGYTPYPKTSEKKSPNLKRKLSQASYDSGVSDMVIESTEYSEYGFNVSTATQRKIPETPHQSTMFMDIGDTSPKRDPKCPTSIKNTILDSVTSTKDTILESVRKAVTLSPSFRKNVYNSTSGSKRTFEKRGKRRLPLWELPEINSNKME